MNNEENKNPETDRRSLLIKAATLIPASFVAITSLRAFAKEAPKAAPAAAGGLKFVAETDPVPKALKYVADATKAKREKRGVTEGKDQFCNNCQLYAAGAPIGGQEAGKCTMIQGGQVHGTGWCASWIKKA
jgi:hypothetical protein